MIYHDREGRPTTLDKLCREEPGNVRWATMKEQSNNRRSNHRITANGVTRTLQEWAEILVCNHTTLIGRLRRGWDPEEAVTTPIMHWYRRGKKKAHLDPAWLHDALGSARDDMGKENRT